MLSRMTRHRWHRCLASNPALSKPSYCAPVPLRKLHSSQANSGSDPCANATGKLIFPDAPTTKHHDLQSFLQYSQRSGLDPKTTTYIGTHYEYTVASSLEKYGFSLQRVGGSSDYGIDLLGTWRVPSSSKPLKVLLQCKALSKNTGPHLVRELEGAFVGAPVGWRGVGVVGLLAAEKPATKGIRDSLGRSRWPMGFITCSRAGQVQQILWNRRAEDEGLEGLGVGMRYLQDDGGEPQLLLTWRGKHLPLSDLLDNVENRAS